MAESDTATPATSEPDVKTLADLPFHVSGRHPKPALLRRCRCDRFEDLSSREFFEQIRDVSLGLTALGIEPGDRVALVADSSPQWSVADLAILTAGAVTVPIYPTLTAEQMRVILDDSAARVAIVADEDQAAKLRGLRTGLSNLEVVAVMAWPREAGGQSVSELPLAVITARGRARLMAEDGLARRFREATAALTADALATIIYTSGTTGAPKGVMLTHANLLSNIRAVQDVIPLTSDDVALSFLPLSHSFERLVLYRYLFHGVTVAFAESLETIGRDLQAVRPTVMTGVPRVYEKIQARILDAVAKSPPVRQRIFHWALGVGWRRVSAELAHRPVPWHVALGGRLADRLVFSKIRARTGGRLRDAVSGSAPLGRETAQFFFSVGIPITEGYGLTETSPVLTVNPPAAPRIGTVGQAISGVTIRIAEDGEILARGPNIMQGYHQKPEATREVLRDEWFHTGDVGFLDADGYLTITDRKKDLIVTAGGKNVAPQPIEALLKRDPLVAEAVLLGDRRRFIAALIAPNLAAVEQQLAAAGEALPPPEQVVARPDVVARFQTIVDATNRDLSRFEQIKRFAVLPVEFTIAGGELTPTMKVRRRVIEARWQETIEALYGDEAVGEETLTFKERS